LAALLFIRSSQAQTFPNIRITPSTIPGDQSECTIAIDPVNPNKLMAAWNDFRDASSDPPYAKPGYAFSTDGGNNWININVVEQHTLDGTIYPHGFDPSCSFDRNGNAYYCYIARPTTPQILGPVHLSKTSNNGGSWTHTRVSPQLTNQDKSFMTIDNTTGSSLYKGRIYVTWLTLGLVPTGIKFAYSIDGGQTFTETILPEADGFVVDNPNLSSEPRLKTDPPGPPLSPSGQGPQPAVGPNGELYVMFVRGLVNGGIEVRKSTDGGQTFVSKPDITPVRLQEKFVGSLAIRTFLSGTIAVDQNTGYVYIAWAEFKLGPPEDYDVYYVYSTNGGDSWSTKQPVTSTTANYQFFPWFSVDPTGRVYLFYMQRVDQTSSNVDVYLAESLNNGVSFLTPLRINEVSSNADNAQFFHDYQGLVSTVGYAYPVWADFRNSNADAYTARVNRPPTSNSSLATAYNSGRRFMRTSNGTLHLVYPTNGEAYYAKSTDAGTSWTDHIRLSTGNGNNNFPAIAGTNTKQYVIWQRYAGIVNNKHRYEMWFAKNLGSGWTTSNTGKFADFTAQTDPLPAITYRISNGILFGFRGGDNSSILTYYSTNEGASWTQQTLGVAGDRNLSMSLSTAPPAGNIWGTYDDGSAVKAANYYISWTGATNISNGATTTSNQYSAVETDALNNVHAAWQAMYTPESVPAIVHRLRTSSWAMVWDYFVNVESAYHRPSITGLASNKTALVWYNSSNQIYKATYNGTSWTVSQVATGGKYPALSAGSTSAKYVWTTVRNVAPYEIKTSSEQLQKSAPAETETPFKLRYHRAIAIADSLQPGALVVGLGDMRVKTRSGQELSIPFVSVIDSLVKLNANNLFDLLTTDFITILPDADSLVFTQRLYKHRAEKFRRQTGTAVKIRFKLRDADSKLALATLKEEVWTELESETRITQRHSLAISNFSGKKVFVAVEAEGLQPTRSAIFALHNIHIVTDEPLDHVFSSPATRTQPMQSGGQVFSLQQNYPNPFNPSTTIRYALHEPSHVRVTILNLNGEEVRALLRADQPAGEYAERWDGKDNFGREVSSGVYIYRLEAIAASGKRAATLKKMILIR